MNTEKSLILSNPSAGWCSFTLKDNQENEGSGEEICCR